MAFVSDSRALNTEFPRRAAAHRRSGRETARLAVAALLAWMCDAAPAAAQAVHDANVWAQVVVTAPVAPDWLLHLEAQPRWSEDATALNQVIARTALGRRLSPRVTVWGGYAWIPRTLGPGTRHEQRAWEQVSVTFPGVGRWTPSLRARVEQRFFDEWADSSHRVRLMGRLVRPLDAEGRWNVAAWDEWMVNLDETAGGPPQGWDQNRLFGGVMRRLTKEVSLEGGYLWHMTRPASGPRGHAHVAFVWLNIVL